MITEHKSPGQIMREATTTDIKIFLAGTIDNGNSADWQTVVRDFFANRYNQIPRDIVFYNPRRLNWDPNCEQKLENPQFYQQVGWELNALEKADYIIMNILPDSKSPITLMELGLYAQSGKLLVCCPREFYRAGNVEMVCDRYNIPLYNNIDTLLNNFVSDYIKK